MVLSLHLNNGCLSTTSAMVRFISFTVTKSIGGGSQFSFILYYFQYCLLSITHFIMQQPKINAKSTGYIITGYML